jgi:hypothetical protein
MKILSHTFGRRAHRVTFKVQQDGAAKEIGEEALQRAEPDLVYDYWKTIGERDRCKTLNVSVYHIFACLGHRVFNPKTKSTSSGNGQKQLQVQYVGYPADQANLAGAIVMDYLQAHHLHDWIAEVKGDSKSVKTMFIFPFDYLSLVHGGSCRAKFRLTVPSRTILIV